MYTATGINAMSVHFALTIPAPERSASVAALTWAPKTQEDYVFCTFEVNWPN